MPGVSNVGGCFGGKADDRDDRLKSEPDRVVDLDAAAQLLASAERELAALDRVQPRPPVLRIERWPGVFGAGDRFVIRVAG